MFHIFRLIYRLHIQILLDIYTNEAKVCGLATILPWFTMDRPGSQIVTFLYECISLQAKKIPEVWFITVDTYIQ